MNINKIIKKRLEIYEMEQELSSSQNNQDIQKKLKSTFENIIQNILKSEQVRTEATGNIIAKLNEFSMKYIAESLEEAKIFSAHAKRNNIAAEDIKFI